MTRDCKVNDDSYLKQHNKDYFETYECKKTKPFKDIGKMVVFMSNLITKAEKLNFKVEDVKVSKDNGINRHYGLFPDSNYGFSGKIGLERKCPGTEPHSSEGWRISFYDNGNIMSQYGKWGQMPEGPKQQKEFMKEHSIDNLL